MKCPPSSISEQCRFIVGKGGEGKWLTIDHRNNKPDYFDAEGRLISPGMETMDNSETQRSNGQPLEVCDLATPS